MSSIMNKQEIDQWAKILMDTHKNPIKKLDQLGSKFFLPTGSAEENELVNNSLNSLANSFKTQRVERRCARSAAKWLPEQKLVEIVKGGGILNNFGFANKNGRFLHPEEALFLLETNRLELFWNEVPMSIQQAYEVILSESDYGSSKYLIYKKLALQGFRLLRAERLQANESSDEPKCKKRKIAENNTCSQMSAESSHLESTKTRSNELSNLAQDVFKKAREAGPKQIELEQSQNSNYKVFLPNNNNRKNADFNLYISESKFVDPSLGFLNDKAIVGYTTSEFSGCFRFESVNLPSLHD